ncbi:MAG: antibiotic biosynthesis monooxygenase [Gammaproteobacteria bacterium]|nr:antibiotic biosynthesis monooxygenase [Gammaproteobacteria bacterium]
MLTIIARPTVDPIRLDELKQAMLDLVDATLKEDGCIRYELHRDNNEPNRFTFLETWENRDLWRKHIQGIAIRAFNERVSGGITGFEL